MASEYSVSYGIHQTGALNPARDRNDDIILGNLGAGFLGRPEKQIIAR
jgi:hypothetical protein